MAKRRTVIAATGSYIPEVRVGRDYFRNHDFRGPTGEKLTKTNDQILDQLEAITGIR